MTLYSTPLKTLQYPAINWRFMLNRSDNSIRLTLLYGEGIFNLRMKVYCQARFIFTSDYHCLTLAIALYSFVGLEWKSTFYLF
jgi:hypothetical protein